MIDWLQSEAWDTKSKFDISGCVFGVTLYVISYDSPDMNLYALEGEEMVVLGRFKNPKSSNIVFRLMREYKKKAEADFKERFGDRIAALLRGPEKSQYRSIDAPMEEVM